jgi:hypothetical protein
MTHTIPGRGIPLAALLIAHICPICSLFAPCHPGAALRDLCKSSRLPGDSFRTARIVPSLFASRERSRAATSPS